jgi:hypothetical protein
MSDVQGEGKLYQHELKPRCYSLLSVKVPGKTMALLVSKCSGLYCVAS